MQMFEVNASSSMQRHPVNPSPTGMRLYDTQGHRLYLTGSEREAFRKGAEQAPRAVRTYCHTLLYTGCRPSEAMALVLSAGNGSRIATRIVSPAARICNGGEAAISASSPPYGTKKLIQKGVSPLEDRGTDPFLN